MCVVNINAKQLYSSTASSVLYIANYCSNNNINDAAVLFMLYLRFCYNKG